ncbi:MAG: ABC transporter ATP-binding protein [Planctomycetes bacterium]|nr:ABC transporter ATP-binding protein [Planctomycetota bacterium]
MSRQVVSSPPRRSLADYSWKVLGVREFAINIVINGAIAYLVYRHATRVPVTGWLSLLVICGPMSFILPLLTTFFGRMNGVTARRAGRAGRVWVPETRWISAAWKSAFLTACVVAPIACAAFYAFAIAAPGVTLSRESAIVFVALYSGVLAYFLHTYAAIRADRLGIESNAAAYQPIGSHGDRRMIVEAKDVSKIFGVDEPRVQALRNANLEIQTGELLAIVGPSGSGKSTLLHILGGLEFPTTGQVLVDGVDLSELDDDARTIFRRQRIGFVFQRFNLLPNLSAVQNVALPLLLDRTPLAQATERARAMLSRVDMTAREKSYPKMLSGGEQQRVAIARALVTAPALILADEPTGQLDSDNSRKIIDLLRTLVSESSHTVVIVTHDGAVASRADRQLSVLDGRVSEIAGKP